MNFLPDLNLSISFIERESHNGNDDDIGRRLFMTLFRTSHIGRIKPHFVVYRESVVEKIELINTVSFEPRQKHLLLSGLSGRKEVHCAALCSAFKRKDEKKGAFCYIEWPDNKWWFGYQFFQETGPLISGYPIVQRAVDGVSKPHQIGAWFSTARRLNLNLNLKLNNNNQIH